MQYLVTTKPKTVTTPIAMVDGTVPGWQFNPVDLHYDHHKQGGADVQIQEMEDAPVLTGGWCMVTTQVDADACVSACWLQLSPEERELNRDKLEAIAYDCDHLGVPKRLSRWDDFATLAVGAMKSNSIEIIKDLGLPSNRKEWSLLDKECFASTAFQRGTEWLIAACKGERPFPGEMGDGEEYWNGVEENIELIIDRGLVSLYRDCLLFDGKGLSGIYIDPRAWLVAYKRLGYEPETPVTLTQRAIFTDNQFRGYSYTLGSIPLHPGQKRLDYTKGVFAALTEAERTRNPNADGWGGRKTVGGSGWNTPSSLLPQEVIDIVLETGW